jgi:hypothetical protein
MKFHWEDGTILHYDPCGGTCLPPVVNGRAAIKIEIEHSDACIFTTPGLLLWFKAFALSRLIVPGTDKAARCKMIDAMAKNSPELLARVLEATLPPNHGTRNEPVVDDFTNPVAAIPAPAMDQIWEWYKSDYVASGQEIAAEHVCKCKTLPYRHEPGCPLA